MSTNNHALIRYRTIDRCLKGGGTYHLKDLILECTDDVSNYQESIKRPKLRKPVSRRTILYDLKFMKDEVVGFGAPIESDKTDGYFYGDPTFEIFKARIAQSDLEELNRSLFILKKISGGGEFSDLESAITRIEETYHIKRNRKAQPIISFEHSTNIDGQKWINHLKRFIQDKQAVTFQYAPFGRAAYSRVISPYLIKEYNNRWFLIGYDHDNQLITNLGLDRILEMTSSIQSYHQDANFSSDSFLKDIVGVSISEGGSIQHIVVKAYGNQKYYIKTKPIHTSQKETEMTEDFGIFTIDIIPNYELYSKLLSYGAGVEILGPEEVREEIGERIKEMSGRYS